jgi:hypothetical protein
MSAVGSSEPWKRCFIAQRMIQETLSLLRFGDTAFPPSERLGGSQ